MDSTMQTYAFLWKINAGIFALLTISLLLVLCMGLPMQAHAQTQELAEPLPYYNSAEFTPHWFNANSKELRQFHKIPPFSFTNQWGQNVTQKTVANKIYVASFFFTSCPGICPAIRSKLAKVQQQFQGDEDVLILSHSIDPERDTVATLKHYADNNGITSPQWHLLTGKQDAIYQLAQQAYFAHEDMGKIAETENFLHTESLLLIDQAGHIRGIYNGLNSGSVDNLIGDIKNLQQSML